MINIGCNEEHRFRFPYDLRNVRDLYITYKQGARFVLEKTLDEVAVSDGILVTYLTGDETILFDANTAVRLQIYGHFLDGTPFKSNVIRTTTDELLKEIDHE